MKPIKTQTRSAKPVIYSGGKSDHSLSIYTYLADVEYQVQAHFEFNLKRTDLEQDRNENKHWYVARRMIERGGRRDVFLGTRECQGYVEPCPFGEGEGHYDNIPELAFGLMFHGFDYPDEGEDDKYFARFWRAIMMNGVVEFPRPGECKRKFIRPMKAQTIQTVGLAEEGLLEGYEGQEVIQ
jgi:CRISPR-associated protein Cas5d